MRSWGPAKSSPPRRWRSGPAWGGGLMGCRRVGERGEMGVRGEMGMGTRSPEQGWARGWDGGDRGDLGGPPTPSAVEASFCDSMIFQPLAAPQLKAGLCPPTPPRILRALMNLRSLSATCT